MERVPRMQQVGLCLPEPVRPPARHGERIPQHASGLRRARVFCGSEGSITIAAPPMSAQPGRNDPCACGSGRKYKHCCLPAADANDIRWHQLRHAEGRLIPELLRVALDAWGADGFRDAQLRFYRGFDPPEDPASDPEFESLFLTWFGLRFAPAALPDAPNAAAVHQHLAAAQGLSDLDERFLIEAARRPVSFHHLTAVDPGRSIDLEDLLTGETCQVVERSASRTVRRGGVLYARTLTLDGVSIMIGCGSTMLPPSYRTDIARVREELAGAAERRLSIDEVAAHDDGLRRWYLEVADQIHHPAPPKLKNTDGDPLAPTTLHFELQCSPDEAFDALRSLNVVENDDDALLADSSSDASGQLHSFHLTWNKPGNRLHASWDNTTLGSIEVEGASLVASANSNRRAGRLRRQIEKRLHGRVLLLRTVVESVDAMLAQAGREGHVPPDESSPELAQVAAALAERHWEEWLDTPVPALGGVTPRQAVTTEAGRERLAALLDDFEWRASDDHPVPVDMLRAELGLR